MKYNVFKRLISIVIILLLAVIPITIDTIPSYAVTPTLHDCLSTTADDGDSASINSGNYCAMQFTTTSAYSVSSLKLMLKKSGDAGDINVSIRTAAAGVPTGTVDTITFTAIDGGAISDSYDWYEFYPTSTSGTSLVGSTQYAIIVRASYGDATHYVLWRMDNTGGLANAVASHSTDGGITWTGDSPKDSLFELYGTTVFDIVNARQFDDYLVDGDMLFVCEYINVYPPYYGNNADPTQYFYLQLYAVDGTTLLAQTTMKAWGDRPGSIYIGEGLASTLTSGSALVIKMAGSFASPPTAETYTLQSGDWLGKASPSSTHTNKLLNVFDKITKSTQESFLDKWVRSTADSIDTYSGYTGTTSSLTIYTQNKGQVLAANSEGDLIFLNGIPSLDQVRPNLFEIITAEINIETATTTNAYNNESTFEGIVGTVVSSDMDSLGDLFGISATDYSPAHPNEPAISVAQKTMGAVLLIVSIIMALFGLFAVGSGFAPVSLFLSMPLMFWGAQIRAIDIRLIGLIVFVLFFICVRRYIWVEG